MFPSLESSLHLPVTLYHSGTEEACAVPRSLERRLLLYSGTRPTGARPSASFFDFLFQCVSILLSRIHAAVLYPPFFFFLFGAIPKFLRSGHLSFLSHSFFLGAAPSQAHPASEVLFFSNPAIAIDAFSLSVSINSHLFPP